MQITVPRESILSDSLSELLAVLFSDSLAPTVWAKPKLGGYRMRLG